MDDTANRSFETLFREEWARVFRVVFRLLGDRDEAEDITVEAFWQLFNRPPRAASEAEVLGWLFRVATNLGYNALRSRRRRMSYEVSAGRHYLESGEVPDPEVEVERSETRHRVRQVLIGMKPRQAKILVLRHSGLSYAEIAAVLKISTGSVGTLITRAEKIFSAQYRKLEGE
jgi:RNA polymerase sigma-70 factor (ECF subfamily)